MPKNKLEPEIEFLAQQVGEFINYWGFKAIEGKIWCLTFISNKPLGPADYIEAFGISKGLVSQCVKRLIEYDVLIEVSEAGKKKQFYKANDDLIGVIKGVLRRRERQILRNVESTSRDLEKLGDNKLSEMNISLEQVQKITELTQMTKSLLEMFVFDEKNSLIDAKSQFCAEPDSSSANSKRSN